MNMDRRRAVLTVAKPQAGSFTHTLPNALTIRDLKITFSIEKTIGRTPNTCVVSVFNLSDDTRARYFKDKPLHVSLDAGYVDNLQRIFTGDLRFGSTLR